MLTLPRFGAAQGQSTGAATPTADAPAPKPVTKSASPKGASDAQIASAKAGGMVWVNTDTGVYHKDGRWYGKTKAGKFMSEDDAKKAGYKSSQKN